MSHDVPLFFGGIRTSDAWGLLLGTLQARGPSRNTREMLTSAVQGVIGNGTVFPFGSARSAITVCLRSAGVGAGDEVVVTGYTCAAVAVAVRATGARAIFADIDTTTLNASVATIASCLGPRTRAIIVQHTLGVPSEVEAIVSLAKQHRLVTIEDCALAIGSTRCGRPIGSFADAAVFSMELSKTITTGWGGVLVVHDRSLADLTSAAYENVVDLPYSRAVRQLLQTATCAAFYDRTLYPATRYAIAALYRFGVFRASTPRGQENGSLGEWYTHRLPEPQTRLAASLWRRLPEIVTRMSVTREKLLGAAEESGALLVALPGEGDTCVSPRISLLVKDRPRAVRWFAKRGIDLGTWFDWPVTPRPTQPEWLGYHPGMCPNAEVVAAHIINIPAHDRIRAVEREHLRSAVGLFFAEHPEEQLGAKGHASLSG